MIENLTLGDVAIAIAFIVALWKGIDFLKDKMNEPQKKMQEQMNLTFRIVYSLLEHEITGDHINDMNSLYNEVKEYLINN